MNLHNWLEERRQNNKVSRALSELPLPEVPKEARQAWMALPEIASAQPTRRHIWARGRTAILIAAAAISCFLTPKADRAKRGSEEDVEVEPSEKE